MRHVSRALKFDTAINERNSQLYAPGIVSRDVFVAVLLFAGGLALINFGKCMFLRLVIF